MEASLKLGNGDWAVKNDSLLAYDDVGGKFRPLPFDFTRASSATVVNKQGLIETVGSGIPRIDFKDDAKGALLLEPQSTNLIPYSEDFSNASWIKTRSSISSNSAISPDGTLNADKLIEGTSTNTHSTQNNVTIGNVDTTISVFVKADTRSRVRFILTDLTTGDYRVDLNLNNLSVIENNGGNIGSWTNTSYKIENFTNNWYKVSLTATKGAGSQAALSINLLDNSGNHAYTGDGTSGIYIYGAQLEQNSYATSYIPTQGAISTRNQDIANNSGIGSLIGQTEGTIFLDFKVLSEDEINANIFNTNKNTANAIAVIRTKSTKKIQVQTFFNSVNANYLATNTCDIGDRIKLAFKYKSGDVKFYINGVLENQSTSTFTISSSLSEINLADNVTYFARKEAIDFTALAVYKTALTDVQLQDLTTL